MIFYIKIKRIFFIAILSTILLGLQSYSSQSSDEMTATVILPDGKKAKLTGIRPGVPLSEIRSTLMKSFDVRKSDKFFNPETGTEIDDDQNITFHSVVQRAIIFEQKRVEPELMWFKWCRPDYEPIISLVDLLSRNRNREIKRVDFFKTIYFLKNYLSQEKYPLKREFNVMDLVLNRSPSDNYIQGFRWYQSINEQEYSKSFDFLLSSFKENLDKSEESYNAYVGGYVPQQRDPQSSEMTVQKEKVVEFLNRMAFTGYQYWQKKGHLYFCASGTPHPYESSLNSLISEISYWSEKNGVI